MAAFACRETCPAQSSGEGGGWKARGWFQAWREP